jgi:hypothetical protein
MSSDLFGYVPSDTPHKKNRKQLAIQLHKMLIHHVGLETEGYEFYKSLLSPLNQNDILALEREYYELYGICFTLAFMQTFSNKISMQYYLLNQIHPENIHTQFRCLPLEDIAFSPTICASNPSCEETSIGASVTYALALPDQYPPPLDRQVILFIRQDADGNIKKLDDPIQKDFKRVQYQVTFSEPGNYKIGAIYLPGEDLPHVYEINQKVVSTPRNVCLPGLLTLHSPLGLDLYLLLLQSRTEYLQKQWNKSSLQTDRDQFHEILDGFLWVRHLYMQNLWQDPEPTRNPIEMVPIQSIFFSLESSEIVPLLLYAKPLKNGGWSTLDVTCPHPQFANEYQGTTFLESWQNYMENNTLPEGYIAALYPSHPQSNYPLLVNPLPDKSLEFFQTHRKSNWANWIGRVPTIEILLNLKGSDLNDFKTSPFGVPYIYTGKRLYGGNSAIGLSLSQRTQIDKDTSVELFLVASGLANFTGRFIVELKDIAGIKKVIVIKDTISWNSELAAMLIIGGEQACILQNIFNKINAGQSDDQIEEHISLINSNFQTAANEGEMILIQSPTARISNTLPYHKNKAEILIKRISEDSDIEETEP